GHAGQLIEPIDRPVDAVVVLVVSHDLDVPADELGRQADVLPAPADGERKLIFLHEHNGAPEPLVEKNLLDGGRLQRVGNHDLQAVVPADDVDAFAAEFVDDVLDAAAADADTGADAIDFHVDRGDGDLGAVAGLAGDRADFDGVVFNLGNFRFE